MEAAWHCCSWRCLSSFASASLFYVHDVRLVHVIEKTTHLAIISWIFSSWLSVYRTLLTCLGLTCSLYPRLTTLSNAPSSSNVFSKFSLSYADLQISEMTRAKKWSVSMMLCLLLLGMNSETLWVWVTWESSPSQRAKVLLIRYNIRILCRPKCEFLLVVAIYLQPDVSTFNSDWESVCSQHLVLLIAESWPSPTTDEKKVDNKKKEKIVGMYSAVCRFFQLFTTVFFSFRRQWYQLLKTYVCLFIFVFQTCLPAFSGSRPICSQIEGCGKRYSEAENEKLSQPRTNALCWSSKHFCRSKGIGYKSSFPEFLDLAVDQQQMGEEYTLQVARCTKIIPVDPKLAEAAKAVSALQGQMGIFFIWSHCVALPQLEWSRAAICCNEVSHDPFFLWMPTEVLLYKGWDVFYTSLTEGSDMISWTQWKRWWDRVPSFGQHKWRVFSCWHKRCRFFLCSPLYEVYN